MLSGGIRRGQCRERVLGLLRLRLRLRGRGVERGLRNAGGGGKGLVQWEKRLVEEPPVAVVVGGGGGGGEEDECENGEAENGGWEVKMVHLVSVS